MMVFLRDFRHLRAAVIGVLGLLLAGCADEIAYPTLLDGEPNGCGAWLGCATQHNIAAVVDRPADLAMPRRDRPRDALRREAILAAWRDGGLDPQSPAAHVRSAQP
jgi:type IV pilus biogenesis protein CpaD/CtpE